jgi:hypothetical protein
MDAKKIGVGVLAAVLCFGALTASASAYEGRGMVRREARIERHAFRRGERFERRRERFDRRRFRRLWGW